MTSTTATLRLSTLNDRFTVYATLPVPHLVPIRAAPGPRHVQQQSNQTKFRNLDERFSNLPAPKMMVAPPLTSTTLPSRSLSIKHRTGMPLSSNLATKSSTTTIGTKPSTTTGRVIQRPGQVSSPHAIQPNYRAITRASKDLARDQHMKNVRRDLFQQARQTETKMQDKKSSLASTTTSTTGTINPVRKASVPTLPRVATLKSSSSAVASGLSTTTSTTALNAGKKAITLSRPKSASAVTASSTTSSSAPNGASRALQVVKPRVATTTTSVSHPPRQPTTPYRPPTSIRPPPSNIPGRTPTARLPVARVVSTAKPGGPIPSTASRQNAPGWKSATTTTRGGGAGDNTRTNRGLTTEFNRASSTRPTNNARSTTTTTTTTTSTTSSSTARPTSARMTSTTTTSSRPIHTNPSTSRYGATTTRAPPLNRPNKPTTQSRWR